MDITDLHKIDHASELNEHKYDKQFKTMDDVTNQKAYTEHSIKLSTQYTQRKGTPHPTKEVNKQLF